MKHINKISNVRKDVLRKFCGPVGADAKGDFIGDIVDARSTYKIAKRNE